MYLGLVVLENGHGADALLLPQFLGQAGRHGLSEHVGRSIGMAFEAYAAVRGPKGWDCLVIACKEPFRR